MAANKSSYLFQISIHPPREGRDDLIRYPWDELSISIHPPREGRDEA